MAAISATPGNAGGSQHLMYGYATGGASCTRSFAPRAPVLLRSELHLRKDVAEVQSRSRSHPACTCIVYVYYRAVAAASARGCAEGGYPCARPLAMCEQGASFCAGGLRAYMSLCRYGTASGNASGSGDIGARVPIWKAGLPAGSGSRPLLRRYSIASGNWWNASPYTR